jgi:hypothetical protein
VLAVEEALVAREDDQRIVQPFLALEDLEHAPQALVHRLEHAEAFQDRVVARDRLRAEGWQVTDLPEERGLARGWPCVIRAVRDIRPRVDLLVPGRGDERVRAKVGDVVTNALRKRTPSRSSRWRFGSRTKG